MPDRRPLLVIDTDIYSDMLRDRLSKELTGLLASHRLCVSFATEGELWHWALLHEWGKPLRRKLEDWLRDTVVLPYGRYINKVWGGLSAGAQRRGSQPGDNDMWIAASCLARGYPLATRNLKDFEEFVDHDGLIIANR